MGKWQKNTYIAMIMAVVSGVVLYMGFTDEKIEQYEQITIYYGDTLWSLADEYRGKMAKEDWVRFVQKENDLFYRDLQAGQIIFVPIEKHSVYIAKLSEEESNSVKVASEYR